MRSLALFLCVAVAAYAADEKKAATLPTGAWTRETDAATLRFHFKKDDLAITAKAGEATMTLTCTCEIDKEGIIKVKITEVKVKGDFPEPPKAGTEMSFKFVVDGKTAKLTDFKSKELEHAKAIVEGEYESKAD